MNDNNYDLIIIGSGVAGLGATLYAGRYGMKVLVVSKEFGGETESAGKIGNYLGVLPIEGTDLISIMKKQVSEFNVDFVEEEVNSIKKDKHYFTISTSLHEYTVCKIIFATGTARRRLSLPNEKELTGKGVHYCVTCDGPVYVGKTIAMVGGGDASVKGAIFATEYVDKVYLIVRDKNVIAEPVNMEHLKNVGDKIEIIYENEVKEIVGKNKLEKIILTRPFNNSTDLIVDGLFVQVGVVPNVDLAKSIGVDLDGHGYIKVNNMMETNIDGVFAAGDTVNYFGSFKQDITAAAMGAVAATSAYNDSKIHGDLCSLHSSPKGLL